MKVESNFHNIQHDKIKTLQTKLYYFKIKRNMYTVQPYRYDRIDHKCCACQMQLNHQQLVCQT